MNKSTPWFLSYTCLKLYTLQNAGVKTILDEYAKTKVRSSFREYLWLKYLKEGGGVDDLMTPFNCHHMKRFNQSTPDGYSAQRVSKRLTHAWMQRADGILLEHHLLFQWLQGAWAFFEILSWDSAFSSPLSATLPLRQL